MNLTAVLRVKMPQCALCLCMCDEGTDLSISVFPFPDYRSFIGACHVRRPSAKPMCRAVHLPVPFPLSMPVPVPVLTETFPGRALQCCGEAQQRVVHLLFFARTSDCFSRHLSFQAQCTGSISPR